MKSEYQTPPPSRPSARTKCVLWQTMVSQCGVSTICHDKQDLQRNLYNGPFQVYCIFVCLFKANVPVNSYGYDVKIISSLNHTFFLGNLNLTKRLTSTSYTYYNKVSNGAKIKNRYNQVPHLTQDTNGKVKPFLYQQEENDHRNYFMINLHESMGPGHD